VRLPSQEVRSFASLYFTADNNINRTRNKSEFAEKSPFDAWTTGKQDKNSLRFFYHKHLFKISRFADDSVKLRVKQSETFSY
jgi:hypothetical protein